MDKIKLKRIIGKQNKAVSPVIATIIMVCLVVAIIAPLVFMMNSTIKEPDIEGFWSLLNNGLPDTDDTDTSEEGTIIGGLACPCDLLIINDNAKIGYAKNRILCTEMEKASLLSDDGEEERYSIEVRSNEVDNLIYQVTCFDDGNYTFTVEYTTSKETRSVAANDINVNEYEVHKYQINWISRPPTITLWIDKEGDGNFEIEITKETDTITNEIIGDAKEPITIERMKKFK